jgi:glucose-1-phosphate adenylyltransferase
VLFSGVRVHSKARLELCIVLPGVTIGHGARIKKAVIDRDCNIPAELIVGEDPELDDQRFVRSPNGVTLITQEMLDRVASNA